MHRRDAAHPYRCRPARCAPSRQNYMYLYIASVMSASRCLHKLKVLGQHCTLRRSPRAPDPSRDGARHGGRDHRRHESKGGTNDTLTHRWWSSPLARRLTADHTADQPYAEA